MRKVLIGLVAGLLLASSGVIWAATSNGKGTSYTLLPGQSVTYAGLTCTAYKGTNATNNNIVCVRNTLQGFGVVVSQAAVVVAKRQGGKVKVYFKAANR
jgi:hypothetical protein